MIDAELIMFEANNDRVKSRTLFIVFDEEEEPFLLINERNQMKIPIENETKNVIPNIM